MSMLPDELSQEEYLNFPINFPGEQEINNSFFRDQANYLEKKNNTTTLKTNLISVDSECRYTTNNITSKTISTRNDFIWSHNGVFRIAIKNPRQLIDNSQHQEVAYSETELIPQQIIVTINSLVNNSVYNNSSEVNIGGLPAHEVVYQEAMGAPYFYAELDTYLEDHDECWYILKNITPLIDGRYGNEGSYPLSLKQVTEMTTGFPQPNHYNVSFKKTFRNITKISLLSSEFPKPTRLTINGLVPSFFAQVDIPKLEITRSINLRPDNCLDDADLTLEIANSLSEVLYDYSLIPFVTKTLDTSLSILNLTVPKEKATKVVLNDTLKLLVKIQGDWKLQFNETVFVNWDGIFGYYRVIETHTLKIKVNINSETEETPQELSTIYLDKVPVGYFVRMSQEGENTYMIITSEEDDAFQIGNRLNFGPLNLVVQVVDMIILGNGLNLLLEYLKNLSREDILSKKIPSREGVYQLVAFRLIYPDDSILQISQLSNLDQVSRVKTSNQRSYNVTGEVKSRGKTSSEISFQTRDLPISDLGFQINEIQNQSRVRSYESNIKYLEVILAELDQDNYLKIYIRNNDSQLHKGQWINLVYQDLPQEYLPIMDILEDNESTMGQSGPTILVNLNLVGLSLPEIRQKYTKLDFIKVKDQEIMVSRNAHQPVQGVLTDSCLRTHRKLPITSVDNFSPGYIIKIGNDIDGKTETNSELNIIERVEEGHDDSFLVARYPISNSRLEGTMVQQLYPIFQLLDNIRAGERVISVFSEHDITTHDKVMGSLNWLSNYLYDFGEETRFISEETIYVERITRGRQDRTYLLHLYYPVDNNYSHNDAYLVLFLENREGDDENGLGIRDISPSSINHHDGQEWFTGFPIVNGTQHRNIPENINIYGMESDNIPVFGLSESDIATRGIQGLDITSNMEHLSDFLSSPREREVLKTITDTPLPFQKYQEVFGQDLVIVKGRYYGRGGIIRATEPTDQLSTDLTFSNLVAHKNGPIQKASCLISRNLLPKDLQEVETSGSSDGVESQSQPPTEILVRVSPLNNIAKPQDEKYNYFYLCCQELPNIQTINGSIGKYKALDGWSFLNNSNYPGDELNMRQQSMAYRHLLNNIFAKIQVDTTSQHYSDGILYNTFVKCSADFSQNPIREISNLTFVCLWPDGQLVDFGYQNHSFTLEITEAQGTLSHINPITGTIN